MLQSLSDISSVNGCEKGNFINCLLFIFGYHSSKNCSKNVSVLIHESDKHKDVQQCSVTVNLHMMTREDDVICFLLLNTKKKKNY